jgi:FemAB-related protein (PEP-CTERM system-associated)
MQFHILRVQSRDPAWDAFVDSHPEATNYHRSGWKRVVEKSFGHEGIYLTARADDGSVQGVLPLVHIKSPLFGNVIVSVPFFNYGGLLCNGIEAEEALLAEAEIIKRTLGVDHLELRHLGRSSPGLVTKNHKVTMILDLASDEEVQWQGFNAKVRNQVRKAQKGGLEIRIGGFDLLDGFYEVFCRNMRDLGTPVYAKKFFRNILRVFPDHTRILSVFLHGDVIASGVLTWHRDSLEVPWASSIRDYRDLCPNNLLYWEAIRFAIGMGIKKFDFGRSTPDEGTYRFKKQWGARPVQLYWQYLLGNAKHVPEVSPANPRYRLAIKIWQNLPVGVTKLIGPSIVRSIP